MSGRRQIGRRGGQPQRPGMALPLTWGLPAAAARELAVREQLAVSALLTGDATKDDVTTLMVATLAAVRAVRLAIKNPKWHQVPVEQLPAALESVYEHARAVYAIDERESRLGKVGCTGPERSTLTTFSMDIEHLREALGRRVWTQALREAFICPAVSIPPAKAQEAAHAA